MVAYFKRQSNLFMLAGAVLTVLALMPFYRGWLSGQEFYMKAFYVALPAFVGVIIGRILASRWANRKLQRLDEMLYQQADTESFVRAFIPLVERAPKETAEYVNGRIKLAYAFEAEGEFEKSLELLDGLKPEELKIHSLAVSALLANQKMRDYLLMEAAGNAGLQLVSMKALQETASGRAPALATNLKECIRLAEVWLGFLEGMSCDSAYIAEEMKLAKNVIHKSEMQLLLAKMRLRQGKNEEAGELLRDLLESAPGLYAADEARRILEGSFGGPD